MGLITSATNEVWRRYCDRYRLSVRPSVFYQDSGHSFESIIAIFGQNMLLYSRRNPIKFESSYLKGIEIVMKIVS